MRIQQLGLPLAALAAVLTLAACSGGTSNAGVASLDGGNQAGASPSAKPTDAETAMLKYTQCMREHGIDMADPEPGQQGPLIRRTFGPGDAPPQDDAKLRSAQEACRQHIEGTAAEPDEDRRAEMQENLLKFAKCMREQGIDMPDPDFSGGRVMMRGPQGVNPDDPKFQAARDKCDDGLQLPGGGPGGQGSR